VTYLIKKLRSSIPAFVPVPLIHSDMHIHESILNNHGEHAAVIPRDVFRTGVNPRFNTPQTHQSLPGESIDFD